MRNRSTQSWADSRRADADRAEDVAEKAAAARGAFAAAVAAGEADTGGIVLVSRHPAVAEFVRHCWGWCPRIVATATAADVRGRVVVGNLPLHLAVEAAAVIAVEFAGDPPRGAEYGLADMLAAGARLRMYTVAPQQVASGNWASDRWGNALPVEVTAAGVVAAETE